MSIGTSPRPVGAEAHISVYRSAANPSRRKFGLAPTPLEAVQNPGWSAQRHRRGRRFCESQLTLPQARPRSPHGGPDASPSGGTHSVFYCQPLPQTILPGARPEKTYSAQRSLSARPALGRKSPSKTPNGAPGGRCFPASVGAIWARKQSLSARLGRALTIAGRTVAPGRPAFSHLAKNRDHRSRAPPPPPAEGATSLLLRRLRGRL